MNFHIAIRNSILAISIFVLTGCSYVSLPSMPWSRPAVQHDATAEALFEEGMALFKRKSYTAAIARFHKVRDEFPFSPQVVPAELKAAEAYYLNKDYTEAITALKEFQALHAANENIPFVVYHLGLAHFDQFTRVDRDQNFTETAKGYFETVVKDYPRSPYAGPAREKLAMCLEYLAGHEFSVGSFYLRQEKYPAARDRFEGIVRRYPTTPTAVEALYYLGEAHRLEKNSVKAALAYSALVQRFPEHPLAKKAQAQLADVTKERHDPLALLLMRDGRPQTALPPPSEELTANRLKDMNFVAKQEVVHEEAGVQKGFFRRVADRLNPFSSSSPKEADNGAEPQSRTEVAGTALNEERSPGFFGSLRSGFGLFSKEERRKLTAGSDSRLASSVDASLQERGVTLDQMATLRPPPSDLASAAGPADAPVPSDTGALLSGVDAKLKRDGMTPNALPPAPEIAEGLRQTVPAEASAQTPADTPAPAQTAASSDTAALLSGIDAGLKQQGITPPDVHTVPPPSSTPETPAPKRPARVELDTNLTLEKGPLFLDPAEVKSPEKSTEAEKPQQAEKPATVGESVIKSSQPLPQKEKPAETKSAQKKKPDPFYEEEEKGVFDTMRDTADRIGNILNPFRW